MLGMTAWLVTMTMIVLTKRCQNTLLKVHISSGALCHCLTIHQKPIIPGGKQNIQLPWNALASQRPYPHIKPIWRDQSLCLESHGPYIKAHCNMTMGLQNKDLTASLLSSVNDCQLWKADL
jgi:hypothetical protein